MANSIGGFFILQYITIPGNTVNETKNMIDRDIDSNEIITRYHLYKYIK